MGLTANPAAKCSKMNQDTRIIRKTTTAINLEVKGMQGLTEDGGKDRQARETA
jgi:hypothetical protein